jgi:Ca2+-binding RTX toxin-like protein
VIAGQGNDIVFVNSGAARSLILGNEGDDTIQGNLGADTISGGSGRDRFNYFNAADDGNGAAGGPIEIITDVNFAEDRFYMGFDVEFVAVTSASGANNLTQAAEIALFAAWQQHGSIPHSVAAVFAFQGGTYLVADSGTSGAFTDSADILLNITGAVGAVTIGNFAHS